MLSPLLKQRWFQSGGGGGGAGGERECTQPVEYC